MKPVAQMSAEERVNAMRLLQQLEKTEIDLHNEQAVKLARDDLVTFTKLMMPHPDAPGDSSRSLYEPALHHSTLAAALQEVESGEYLRFLTSIPPRHGKSLLCSRHFPAWFVGRDPYRHVILATYSQTLAEDFGRSVRDIMRSEAYQKVFPNARLKVDSQSVGRLETVHGGVLMFVGRGGSLTGRGADLLVIDDPLKDRDEADSTLLRNKLWEWYTQTAYSRLMTASGRVVIVQTRWHEDDLIGRLIDKNNPVFNEKVAKGFRKLDLPAIAEDKDPMGRKPGEALWPQRFDLKFLEASRDLDPRGFSALYQGRPSPETGYYFESDYLRTYKRSDLPSNLRIYAASDHAVSTQESADKTCCLLGGVDEDNNLYILPDLFWQRASSDQTVEQMLRLAKAYTPMLWWAEKGHISQSLGPFLRRRMSETNIMFTVDEVNPTKNKATRAQSIRARMSIGKVLFPSYASWWYDARSELLKFPYGRHDDFVDALAHLGMGLDKQVGRAGNRVKPTKEHKPGTMGWFKQQQAFAAEEQRSGEAACMDGF